MSSTHSMEWGEADGKYFVYPTVVERGGKLVDISGEDPFGYAMKTGEYIMFNTPEEAARAYDEYAKVCYGEFATLNFPDVPLPAEDN